MKFLTKFAGLLSFIVGAVLIKVFGTSVGLAFMIITIVLIIGASAVLRELTKLERKKFQNLIREMLNGSPMYEHLIENPARLDQVRTWDDDHRKLLYDVLESDDAARVKQLLGENPRAR